MNESRFEPFDVLKVIAFYSSAVEHGVGWCSQLSLTEEALGCQLWLTTSLPQHSYTGVFLGPRR